MTTLELKLNLPDRLAREAQAAGLLTPEAMEAMLREQLQAQRQDGFFAAMGRMEQVAEPPAMSPGEVAEEMRAMRAERRAKAPG